MAVIQTPKQWIAVFVRRATLPFVVGMALGMTMPIAMRFWVRVMQISPSGLMAKAGFVLGALAFIAAIAHSFIGVWRVRRARKEGRPTPSFSAWPFTMHIFFAYWWMIPSAVCITLSPLVGPSSASWARNEDRIVQAGWNTVLGRHPE